MTETMTESLQTSLFEHGLVYFNLSLSGMQQNPIITGRLLCHTPKDLWKLIQLCRIKYYHRDYTWESVTG